MLLVVSGCSNAKTVIRTNAANAAQSIPKIDSCFLLSPSEIPKPSATSLPVDCNALHNSETFKVATISSDSPPADLGSTALHALAAPYCDTTTIYKENFTAWVFYVPTDKQWQLGARWVRCDAMMSGYSEPAQWKGSLLEPYRQMAISNFNSVPVGVHKNGIDWPSVYCRNSTTEVNVLMCFVFIQVTNKTSIPQDVSGTAFAVVDGNTYSSTQDPFLRWLPWDGSTVSTLNPAETTTLELHFNLPNGAEITDVYIADAVKSSHLIDTPMFEITFPNIY